MDETRPNSGILSYFDFDLGADQVDQELDGEPDLDQALAHPNGRSDNPGDLVPASRVRTRPASAAMGEESATGRSMP